MFADTGGIKTHGCVSRSQCSGNKHQGKYNGVSDPQERFMELMNSQLSFQLGEDCDYVLIRPYITLFDLYNHVWVTRWVLCSCPRLTDLPESHDETSVGALAY